MAKETDFNHWAAVGAAVNFLGSIVPRAGIEWAKLDEAHRRIAMRDAVVEWCCRRSKRLLRWEEMPGQEQAAITQAVAKFESETWPKLDFSTGRMALK